MLSGTAAIPVSSAACRARNAVAAGSTPASQPARSCRSSAAARAESSVRTARSRAAVGPIGGVDRERPDRGRPGPVGERALRGDRRRADAGDDEQAQQRAGRPPPPRPTLRHPRHPRVDRPGPGRGQPRRVAPTNGELSMFATFTGTPNVEACTIWVLLIAMPTWLIGL